ncbi:hypothetical protein IE077_002665 [Cardiosporidium cionae]|uniref:RNA helicase n=1 Tax=Cardiosporidium cionae TaxID=476202 RepID=A0ABQ7JAG0_9APIC|nr:hypothetical protein IE077_002665 [Cardiosporidium cionae]|eukprot:KAF8820919.1 hypothetical protein IE077_002665 [Cardiosporidium cionae]
MSSMLPCQFVSSAVANLVSTRLCESCRRPHSFLHAISSVRFFSIRRGHRISNENVPRDKDRSDFYYNKYPAADIPKRRETQQSAYSSTHQSPATFDHPTDRSTLNEKTNFPRDSFLSETSGGISNNFSEGRENASSYTSNRRFPLGRNVYETRPSVQIGKRNHGNFMDRTRKEPDWNLPVIQWSQIQLPAIKKDFFMEHPNVSLRSQEDITMFLKEAEISIKGSTPVPKPVFSFEEACFPVAIQNAVFVQKFSKPSHIQCMGWPIAMSGRDLVAIAKTGSGKTLAYLLPALVHISAQPPLQPGEGPVALVLVPTRELAQQVVSEAQKFSATCGVRTAAVYGGSPIYLQRDRLFNGVELLVATPGRLLDFLKNGVTNLRRTTYLVLDEGDRMLDMGFEPQVGSGELQANPDVEQNFIVIDQAQKESTFFRWLETIEYQKILVFCETKRECDELSYLLRKKNCYALALHGDKNQRERDRTLSNFRNDSHCILVATDVASRGLDISGIDFVVNYAMPKSIEDYIHRIGRTGRAGSAGKSMTFFVANPLTTERRRMAREISQVLQNVGQAPHEELHRVAGWM